MGRSEVSSALASSEVRALTDSVKDYAIFVLDPAGTVLTWNTGAQTIKGYTPAEIVGRSFKVFYTPEDLAAGKPELLLEAAAREGRVEDEGWRVRKDGSRFWADVVVSPIFGAGGRLDGFVKVTRDLTERRRAQESLAERASQQAAVSELGLFALQTPDLNEVMERAVETARATLRVPVASALELAGDSELVLRAGVGVQRELVGVARLPATPRTQAGFTLTSSSPVVVEDASAETAFGASGMFESAPTVSGVSVVIHAPDQAGRPYGVLGVRSEAPRRFTENDVRFLQAVANVIAAAISRRRVEEQLRAAERKALEERGRTAQAQQALRDRDDFISVAAHELRTPLTALQLKLQSLERGLNESARQPVEARSVGGRVQGAVRQTERLARLVERLLDVSRIASGQLEMSREQFDLGPLMRQVADDFREPAAQAGSELHLEVPEKVEGCWDRLRLEQVLVNLISNAVKYGAGKPIRVHVEVAGDHVKVTVADRGIGIAEDDLTRIFTRFERAAPLRQYGGMGLGLYITKHIVEAHGGAIAVSSSAGEGSTFVVELPRFAAPGAVEQAGPPRVQA